MPVLALPEQWSLCVGQPIAGQHRGPMPTPASPARCRRSHVARPLVRASCAACCEFIGKSRSASWAPDAAGAAARDVRIGGELQPHGADQLTCWLS
jgi:hypothetical protein